MIPDDVIPGFDCVESKRKAQAEIYEEIRGLSPPDEIRYFEAQAIRGPLGNLWRALHERDETAESESLAVGEKAEGYLPRQMSEAETREIVKATIAKLGVSLKKDLGQVMKAVLAEHKGKVDGKLVQRLASEMLG